MLHVHGTLIVFSGSSGLESLQGKVLNSLVLQGTEHSGMMLPAFNYQWKMRTLSTLQEWTALWLIHRCVQSFWNLIKSHCNSGVLHSVAPVAQIHCMYQGLLAFLHPHTSSLCAILPSSAIEVNGTMAAYTSWESVPGSCQILLRAIKQINLRASKTHLFILKYITQGFF